MPGIGIITNPHSKLNRRHPSRQRLLGYIVGEHGKLELTNSLDDLARAAVQFRDHRIEVLAINGGDGTISRTLTAFIRAYQGQPLPKVLILRGGTINVLSDNLGIKGSPEAILVRYIESMSEVRTSTTQRYYTLAVGDHYGFLFGNGMVASYLEEFYRNKSGPAGAIYLLFKVYLWRLFRKDHFLAFIGERSYRLHLNHSAIALGESRSCAVMASSIEKMPLGPRLFPDARMKRGHFSIFSLEIPAISLPWRLPLAVLFNKQGRRFGRVNRLVESLKLDTADGRVQKYSLDGELFEAHDGKLEISLGPEVEFIVV